MSCKNECSKGFSGQRISDVITTKTTHTTQQQTTESTPTTFIKTDPITTNRQPTKRIITQLTTTQSQRNSTGTSIIRTEPQETTVPLKTTTSSENVTTLQAEAQTNGSVSTVWYIVIAVIAGLVLIVVTVFLIICVKRRKRTRRRDQESSPHDSNNEEYAYAKPDKGRKMDSQKGESNAIDLLNKDPSLVQALEQSNEKSNQVCRNVSTHVTDTTLDTAGIILETCLDESETAATDANSSTGQSMDDDTYYNVLSFQRNKVKVDKFEEYVKSKSTLDFFEEFQKFPKGLSRPYTHATRQESMIKCRFKDVYPYDTNRVKLLDKDNDFINASYIDGYRRQQEYIASLGPTKATMADFVDFWAMIWQDKVEKIVMLTKLVEATKMKCEQYWPDVGDTISYGDVIVMCQTDDVNTDYTFRTFSVKKNQTTRLVYQAHFLSWPDKRVPESTDVLLTFIDKVKALKSETEGPIVVHCSAGVGRTGTFIALDILLQQLTEEGAVDVFGCVIGIRGQRVAMVQTLEQYEFIHNVLVESIQKNKV